MKKTLSSPVMNGLRCFDAAARTGSFTRAAAELNLTQGAISQHVKNLETYLGTSLFIRGSRTLMLTDDGETLRTGTEAAFRDLERTINRLRREGETHRTTAISCSPSFAMLWLTPRISDLTRAHPEISIRIHGEFHMLDKFRMEEDNIEAGIRFDPGYRYVDVMATEFLDEWIVPVTTPAFLARHPEIMKTGQISPEYMLHDTRPWDQSSDHTEWNRWLTLTGRTVPEHHTGLHFNLSQLALTAALSGHGVAMGRLALVYDTMCSGHLVAPIPIAVKAEASYSIVVSPKRESEGARVLRKWLISEGHRFKHKRDQFLQLLHTRSLIPLDERDLSRAVLPESH